MLNKVTAISGSGPAYFFAFMEALRKVMVLSIKSKTLTMQAGEQLGFDRALANRLAIGTALGAALLAAQPEAEDVSVLRERVTSKGGTTESALNVFKSRDLDGLVHDAVKAALERARYLSRL